MQVNGLIPCPDPHTCLSISPRRPTPPPSFHLHLDASESGTTVELFIQSETLWFLPPLNDLIPPCSDQIAPGFLVASDRHTLPPWRPGRGRGYFKEAHDHQVIVPSAHVLLEAFLRIYARTIENYLEVSPCPWCYTLRGMSMRMAYWKFPSYPQSFETRIWTLRAASGLASGQENCRKCLTYPRPSRIARRIETMRSRFVEHSCILTKLFIFSSTYDHRR